MVLFYMGLGLRGFILKAWPHSFHLHFDFEKSKNNSTKAQVTVTIVKIILLILRMKDSLNHILCLEFSKT